VSLRGVPTVLLLVVAGVATLGSIGIGLIAFATVGTWFSSTNQPGGNFPPGLETQVLLLIAAVAIVAVAYLYDNMLGDDAL
jgi:hypothetical protein